MLKWLKRNLSSHDPHSVATNELIATCERFWDSPTGDYAKFASAYNELANRGPEIRDWCQRLLTHREYAARESGAFLLGQLGSRGQLGDAVEAIVAELGALTARPVEEDAKELQAVDAAIEALARIGHPFGIPFICDVIMSDDEFLVGDSQWEAAGALSRLVSQPFMESPDPVAAARAWITGEREL